MPKELRFNTQLLEVEWKKGFEVEARQEAEMDDFSFPTVAVDPEALCHHPFPHFASPPLWFLSSVSDPKAAVRQRKSFSSAEDAFGGGNQGEDFASVGGRSPALSDDGNSGRFLENEKMDMLWEDFNEELARLSYHHKRQASEDSTAPCSALPSPGGVGSKSRKGSSGSKSLAMTKSSSMIQHRRPSLMTMVKLLKRLFLVQNPRSSRKTQHCDEQDPPAS